MGDTQDLPDYVLDPNAVLKDTNATCRYGKPPDYTKTRDYYERTRRKTHEPHSLEDLVTNLVKNWEIEASFKTSLSDWRTISQDSYTFSLNGGIPQPGSHMFTSHKALQGLGCQRAPWVYTLELGLNPAALRTLRRVRHVAVELAGRHAG